MHGAPKSNEQFNNDIISD